MNNSEWALGVLFVCLGLAFPVTAWAHDKWAKKRESIHREENRASNEKIKSYQDEIEELREENAKWLHTIDSSLASRTLLVAELDEAKQKLLDVNTVLAKINQLSNIQYVLDDDDESDDADY